MPGSRKTRTEFDRARETIEGRTGEQDDGATKQVPPAGPHAKEEATDKAKTPGSGALSPPKPRRDVETGTG